MSVELRDFFQYLQDMFYKHFSKAIHLSRYGLYVMVAPILAKEFENREDIIKKTRSDCAFHNITLVLALLSEIEKIYNFGQKEKLKYLWHLIGEYYGETKEVFDKRYKKLLI